MTAALVYFLLAAGAAQQPVFHDGDHWSMDRTVHFVNSGAEIDLQNDDQFQFRVKSDGAKRTLEGSRLQKGTHLPGGVFVPSPPGGEPEVWTMPISSEGRLSFEKGPIDPFEMTLTQILIAAWNGEAPGDKPALITLKPLAPNRERIAYDGAAVQDRMKLDGSVTFDPVSHAPLLISLRGTNVTMPGGSDRVSVKVEYKRG